MDNIKLDCSDGNVCNPKDKDCCAWCGHNCDLSAITIASDEDVHCHTCGKNSIMSHDGTLKKD